MPGAPGEAAADGEELLLYRAFWPALALAVLASACGGGRTYVIPQTQRPGNASYTLLYSTLGYDSGATKRVLIRQNDTNSSPAEGMAFAWRLIDEKGHQAAAGQATYAGRAWGIPLWAADFSKVTTPGRYRLAVTAPEVDLATDAFPVDRFLYFRSTFSMIGVENAQARAAPAELDGGYYDANSREGRVADHVDFLVGMSEVYQRRRAVMTEDQRSKTRDAIDRSIEYLLAIGDAGSGRFPAESRTRPYNDDAPTNTAAALRGLAHYAVAFQTIEPEKADRVYRRALLSQRWLDQQHAPGAYPPALAAAVNYDLYRYSSDPELLVRAAAAVRAELSAYDLRTMDRPGNDNQPHFEAMYRMWRDLQTHPDRQLWEDGARKVAAQYRDMLERNVFQIIPSGVTNADDKTSATDQWDRVDALMPPGDGPGWTFSNGWILARAIDATYLASITHDAELEKVATASLAWIGGLNPGLPAERVLGADAGSPLVAASFLTGLDVRTADPWSSWEWQRTRAFATIVNGFKAAFAYDDSFDAAETSLGYDGSWLYATAVYEDYVDAGKRPPPPDAAPAAADGVHVASVEPSQVNGLLQLLVHVASADGAPAAGVRVSGAWSGAPAAGHSIEESVVVNTCTTTGSGSCVLLLAAGSLPVTGPVAVGVTNLEDRLQRYDITRDGAQSASFQ
ncbi:MAG: hypothetical protein EPO22_02325 [Dehalococcoidia bacterium]|nr:MAG: hypothetical protein EPO22_02325 [Dehalococcoidia bacterium]